MSDIGRVHQRTSARQGRASKGHGPRLRPGVDTDRYGRVVGLRSAQDVLYEVCTMCGERSMVRTEQPGQEREWRCEACGYRDNAERPLN